jgi:hypothetical protein
MRGKKTSEQRKYTLSARNCINCRQNIDIKNLASLWANLFDFKWRVNENEFVKPWRQAHKTALQI